MEKAKRPRGNGAAFTVSSLDLATGSEGAPEGVIGSPDYIPLLATVLLSRDYISHVENARKSGAGV
jgi:hypothetical protein